MILKPKNKQVVSCSVSAYPFEYGGAIVKGMGHYGNRSPFPFNKLAIKPDVLSPLVLHESKSYLWNINSFEAKGIPQLEISSP
jgi:hypothetical protein